MTNIDERLDLARRELHDELDGLDVAPPTLVARRHHRRRHVAGALAAVIVLGGVGAIGVVALSVGDGSSSPAAEPGTETPAPDEPSGWLLPDTIAEGETPEVVIVPPNPNGATGALLAPDGTLFRVSVWAASGGRTPDAEQRRFGDLVFDVEVWEGVVAYTSLDECARLTVTHPAAGNTEWSADAVALLDSLSLTDRQAAIDLPDGWEWLGARGSSQLVQLAYRAEIDGDVRFVNLAQMTDTAAPLIPSIGGALPEPTTFRGQRAWTYEQEVAYGPSRTLLWNEGDDAVMLTVERASLDQLTRYATESLSRGQTIPWDGQVDLASVGTVPDTTLPGGERPADCGPSTLTVQS